VAVEPRHDSWWTPEVRAVLEGRGAALCWADVGSRAVTPLWRTTDWAYLRLHVGCDRSRPRYGRRALNSWVRRIAGTWTDHHDVHVYFNNDPGGAAVVDAIAFARRAAAVGMTVTRTPRQASRRSGTSPGTESESGSAAAVPRARRRTAAGTGFHATIEE
jgi:uncharacterized protein YecE (DUF72 family)